MAIKPTRLEESFVGESQPPQQPKPKLLAEFEEYIGTLERTETAHPECPLWFWSWSLQNAKLFLREWQDARPMLIPLLRDLARTVAPSFTTEGHWVNSNQFLYKLACKPEVRSTIDQAEDITGPTGGKTPYPHGNVRVDLRCRTPGFRTDVYTINDHTFYIQADVDGETAKQLRYMHGANEAEKLRIMQGYERQIDLGEIR